MSDRYLRPGLMERVFNRAFGSLVRAGLGLRHNYIVQVRGRKSGKIYSNPVDVLDVQGHRYLVAPRGRTQWVRNAESAGEVRLVKGKFQQKYAIVAVPDADKPPLIKEYLDRFATTVQRYFPVKAGSALEAFISIAPQYPVFELTPI